MRINASAIIWRSLALASLSIGSAGCGSSDGPAQNGEVEDTASVEVALTTVPASALCIRITATPASGAATTRTFAVTGGATSANLQVGKLLSGNYTLSGDAFNVACASIGNSVGDWIADPVAVTLRTGSAGNVTLTFRKSSQLTTNANFVSNVQGVALGLPNTFVATDGGILQTGAVNGSKVLVRTNFAAFDSTSVPGNAVASLAATYNGACAARVDGTVWCWGTSYNGELGPGGSSTTPLQVTGLTGATQVSAGMYHACALANGAGGVGVYCWGDNSYGQLGVTSPSNSRVPLQAYAGYFKTIACGQFSTYAVYMTGQLYSWGSNSDGQLGDGTTTQRSNPVSTTESPVQTVVAGYWHACAMRVDGSVRCWGNNGVGQLGNGTTSGSYTPVQVSGLTARQLVAGAAHNCAVNSAGQTVCWGNNVLGQIGDGTNVNRLTPTAPVLGTTLLTSLAGGSYAYTTCGLTAGSDLYCWGGNNYGNLGDGTNNAAFLPVKVQLQ